MKIVLIRHAMTEGNYKKRYIGSTDEPLADTKSLNLCYPHSDTVFISPLKRCRESAEFIYPDREKIVCPDLCECDFGDFENKSYEDLKGNAAYRQWISCRGKVAPPMGESNATFTARCVRGFYECLDMARDKAVFIIHGGTIMAIMQSLFGGDFYDYQIRCGGMITFEFDKETKKTLGDYVREE